MKKRSFENWDTDSLELEFDIKKLDAIPLLTDWLQAPFAADELEKIHLEKLRSNLAKRILEWKEQEIIMHFIGPLLTLAQMDGDNFSGFAARKIAAVVGDWEISGLVDYMIATGKHNPRQPFFCFHEYKAERRRDSDPLGQVLAAMLAAQTINKADRPLFGAFINGRNWFFLVLQGKKYAMSKAFDSSDSDILRIFAILRDLKKRIIDENVAMV